MQFKINAILDELPEEKREQTVIHKRVAVRGVIHYNDHLLMVETNRGDFKFPGGGIEENETMEAALLREIIEETGYSDIEIGNCIGNAFEQNIEPDDDTAFFQMESYYYECRLRSDKRAPGVLDDYEEKLGFKGKFVSVSEILAANEKLLSLQMDKEIPWLLRETYVMRKLNRTLVEKISDLVKECGKTILNADRSKAGITAKEGHANFVTAYDKKVQEMLREGLLEILPEAEFVGEEDEDVHASIQHGYAYIVDPIDGTTNFIKDYHASSISVALLSDGVPQLGVIYNPYLDELFYAEKEKGAFLNAAPIHVSKQPLSKGLVLFGTAPYNEELAEKSFKMAYEYFKQAMDIRRSGSAAIDLCSIACGRAELYFELKLSPWDFAAGALIVEEAGGKVTTVEGTPLTYDKPCSLKAVNF